ncbi:hypothetical protein ACHAXS_000783 [Conticribra weissflogii]
MLFIKTAQKPPLKFGAATKKKKAASAAFVILLSIVLSVLNLKKLRATTKISYNDATNEISSNLLLDKFNTYDESILPNLGRPPKYSPALAKLAIRPSPWTCGDEDDNSIDPLTNQRPIFVFVHIYKTAGSTLRSFFFHFAALCKKSWMLLISCTEVNLPSIQTDAGNWKNCKVKGELTRDGNAVGRKAAVSNAIVRERIDVLLGHLRIGTADYSFPTLTNSTAPMQQQSAPPPLRYILVLRNPMDRFVSGVIFQLCTTTEKGLAGNVTQEEVVRLVKKKVRNGRKSNQYHERILKYLLTPVQVDTISKYMNRINRYKSAIRKEKNATQQRLPNAAINNEEEMTEYKARLAIHNLFHYNAIVGMTEQMPRSMNMIRHALGDKFQDDDRKAAFNKFFEFYGTASSSKNELNLRDNQDDYGEDDKGGSLNEDEPKGFVRNSSAERGVSTSLVLEELRKDEEFMQLFAEFVKYEQMIVDFGWKMHLMQYEEYKKAVKL